MPEIAVKIECEYKLTGKGSKNKIYCSRLDWVDTERVGKGECKHYANFWLLHRREEKNTKQGRKSR